MQLDYCIVQADCYLQKMLILQLCLISLAFICDFGFFQACGFYQVGILRLVKNSQLKRRKKVSLLSIHKNFYIGRHSYPKLTF